MYDLIVRMQGILKRSKLVNDLIPMALCQNLDVCLALREQYPLKVSHEHNSPITFTVDQVSW